MDSSAQAIETSRPWRAWLLLGAGLVAAAWLVGPSLRGGFLADDFARLDRAQVASFTERPGQWLTPGDLYFLRPVASLAWSVEYSLFGAHPVGYRGASLLLHLLVCLAVFGLFRQVVKKEGAAVGACVFALFPVHAEAVAWPTAQADLMAAGLFILALTRYLAWRRGSDRGGDHPVMVAIFGLLAMLAHESACALPLVLAAAEVLPGNQRSRKARGLTIAVVAAAALALSAGRLHHGGGPAAWGAVPGNLAMSLLRLFFPTAYSPIAPWTNYLFVGALILAAAAFIKQRRAWRGPAFALLFMVTAALPAALAGGVGLHLESSRVLYLPSAATALLAALLLDPGENQAGRLSRLVLPVLTPLMFLALIAGLHLNLQPWVEAGRAARSVKLAFLKQAVTFQPGQSAQVEGVPLTIKGVPFQSDSSTLSVAFSLARFPAQFRERTWADRHTLPFYAVLPQAPTSPKWFETLDELQAGRRAFDYNLRWSIEKKGK